MKTLCVKRRRRGRREKEEEEYDTKKKKKIFFFSTSEFLFFLPSTMVCVLVDYALPNLSSVLTFESNHVRMSCEMTAYR